MPAPNALDHFPIDKPFVIDAEREACTNTRR